MNTNRARKGFGIHERVPVSNAKPAIERPSDRVRVRADANKLGALIPRGLLPRVK